MNQVMTDIWPILLPTILALAVGYVSFIHKLRIEVAVLKTTVVNLLQTVDGMQKRQDSHSKKQDEIVKLITDLKVDFTKEIGRVSMNVGTLTADIRNLTSMIEGSNIKKEQK